MYFLNLKDKILGKIYIKQKDVYFKYSTEEQFTGEYWLDGKKIYTTIISWTDQPTGVYNRNHNIQNIDKIISYEVTCRAQGNGGLWFFPVVYYGNNGTSGTFYDTQFQVNKTQISGISNCSWQGYDFEAKIKYTKATE